ARGLVQRQSRPGPLPRFARSVQPVVETALPSAEAAAPGRAGAPRTPGAREVTVGVGGNFVSEVYKAASPAVVHITNHSTQRDFFFQPVQQESTASGVIVNASGYILTNYHVIENANDLSVVLHDG